MKIKKERLKIWPGVTPAMVCHAVREWCQKKKVNDLLSFDDMKELDFDHTPTLKPMLAYWELCLEIVKFCKNAVLGHVCCKRAWHDLLCLEPQLLGGRQAGTLPLELSRGLRTVMCWYRECAKKGPLRGRLLKGAAPSHKDQKEGNPNLLKLCFSSENNVIL